MNNQIIPAPEKHTKLSYNTFHHGIYILLILLIEPHYGVTEIIPALIDMQLLEMVCC